MRTLKKSLCLVLALVMVLGLFVVGANAAYTPYGDEATINPNYLDAIQVLTGLKVIEGRTGDERNFDPLASSSRESRRLAHLPFSCCGGTDVPSKNSWRTSENK